MTSGSRDSTAASASLKPGSTGTAAEQTTTQQPATSSGSTSQEKTPGISDHTNSTENTTDTATTNASPAPQPESDNNRELPGVLKPFTNISKKIHLRFNKEIAKTYVETRNQIRRAPTTLGQPLDSWQKEILLGDSLNQLNQQFSTNFLNIYKNAHRFMKSLGSAATSDNDHRTAQSLISARVMSEFQTMYATFSDIRLQMLSDLGYTNQQPLDCATILRLSSGVYSPPAVVSRNTAHLLKAIEQQPQPAKPDGFDRFMADLGQSLRGTTGQKQQSASAASQPPGNTGPVEQQPGDQFNSDILARQKRPHNHQLLTSILQQEQTLLLESIQQPNINPVRKLESCTTPTHQTRGMASVQPDPGQSSGHPVPSSGKASTPSAIASTPGPDSHTAKNAITPADYPVTDNLTLANLLAAKISDRPIHLNNTMAPQTTDKHTSPLDQSPGMRLLTDSQALAGQLREELSALANDLATPDKQVSTQWDQDDLINLAIVQTLPKASTGKVTENFLLNILTSTSVGIQHQQPDHIFRADGSLRGTSQASGAPLFRDPSTGQTTDHGATRQLAKIMLQAMARSRLADQAENNEIPQLLSNKIIDQATQLHSRQPQKFIARLSQWLGLEQGSQASARASLATRLELRLSSSQRVDLTPPTDLPLVNSLVSGRYHKTQSRFMNLAPARQLELLETLASQPDYLGLDHFAEPLARLEADFAKATQAPSAIPEDPDQPSDRQPPDWQTFQLNQKAWQLFTHLYNARFEAPAEAINRIKTAALIQRQGIEPHPDDAQRLNQLVVALLPVRTSASDRARLINTRDKALPGPVRLHQFNRQRITEILNSYAAIKSLVSRQFQQVFGDQINDAQLQEEVIAQLARTSLQELKGKTTGQWQQAVTRQMNREFADFRNDPAEAS